MRKIRNLPVQWLLMLAVFGTYATAQNVTIGKIVAQRALPNGKNIAITVDQDDRIRESVRDDSGSVSITAELGGAITSSGSINLEKTLGREQIAFWAQRFTQAPGVVNHVVLTWGFSSGDRKDTTVYCSLRIFRQTDGRVETVIEEELGVELHQLIIADVNGDGLTEILISTRDGKEETIVVYQAKRDGTILRVQEIAGSYVYTPLGRFINVPGLTIIVHGERMTPPRAGVLCVASESYRWSAGAHKFVKSDVQRSPSDQRR